MKKLGVNQTAILSALIEYKGWQKRCGWIHKKQGMMFRVLDSLVKSGYVMNHNGFYYAVKGIDGNALTVEQKKLIDDALDGEIAKQNKIYPLGNCSKCAESIKGSDIANFWEEALNNENS